MTGFGDHEELYGKLRAQERLPFYARHFSIVEIDSSFYAVQPVKNYARWAEQTPEAFRFIVKAYQGMTGHTRGRPERYYADDDEMFAAFRASVQPLAATGKLAMALFQYPPWFDCTKENVDALRAARERMGDMPCALEFRHNSWYSPEFRERTLQFMQREEWIHTVVDEPQTGSGTVPVIPVATSPDMTYVRLHGRNAAGWQQSGQPDWRRYRYLYRYNTEELLEWRDLVLSLQKSSKNVYVVFNNNSGGDATDNAKELQSLLGQELPAPEPTQLELFGEE